MSRESSHRSPRKSRSGFTLLEVILGVFILGLVGLSIYRFLELNLSAIQVSTEHLNRARSLKALVDIVQAQMNDLPVATPNAVRGEAYKFNDVPQDELEWIARAGNGLFTEHAAKDYRVTLSLRQDERSGIVELGLRRVEEGVRTDVINWLPLMTGIAALEVRYYDPRAAAWLERWTQPNVRPSLIRMRFWRDGEEFPYESVLSLPAREFTADTEAGA
jgi:type II secretion system protein J